MRSFGESIVSRLSNVNDFRLSRRLFRDMKPPARYRQKDHLHVCVSWGRTKNTYSLENHISSYRTHTNTDQQQEVPSCFSIWPAVRLLLFAHALCVLEVWVFWCDGDSFVSICTCLVSHNHTLTRACNIVDTAPRCICRRKGFPR